MTATQTDDLAEAEISRLLASGRKIDAIKVAREMLGLDLASAKRMVETIEAGAAHYRTTSATPSADVEARIRAALGAGRRAEAVRLFREATGSEMKVAHDAVRAMEGDFKHGGDDAAVLRSGGRRTTIAMVVVAAALLAIWYAMGWR